MATIVEQQRFTGRRIDRLNEHTRSQKTTARKTADERFVAPDKSWGVYDCLLDESTPCKPSFAASFLPVLPSEYRESERPMADYIETYFQNRKENGDTLLALEIGGPGSALFTGVKEGFFAKTAGITLVDGRDPDERIAENEQLNHTVLEGNFRTPRVKEKVDAWREERKVDFIIERMCDGLKLLPRDPFYLAEEFSYWYELLNEEGVMFIQLPMIVEPLLADWEQRVLEETDGTIEMAMSNEGYGEWWAMRLNKHAGAPEKLPFLSPREVRTIYDRSEQDEQQQEQKTGGTTV